MGQVKNSMGNVTRQGFPFSFDPRACQKCHHRCCRGEAGNVWVDAERMAAICRFLGCNLIDGMQRYFIRRQNRLAIREMRKDHEHVCIFLRPGVGCTIYPVRPRQCREFPFWPHYKAAFSSLLKECPGVFPL